MGLNKGNIQDELKSLRNEKRKQIVIVRNKKFTHLGMPKEEIMNLFLAKGKITTLLPPLDPNANRMILLKYVLAISTLRHSTEEC